MSYETPAGRRLAILAENQSSARVIGERSDRSSTVMTALVAQCRRERRDLYALLEDLRRESHTTVEVDLDANVVRDAELEFSLSIPVDAPEIWAAGVSYLRSRRARERESAGRASDVYSLVYDAERPELFLKDAACRRTVAPGAAVAVRGDSSWTVPEPELGLVLDSDGEIVAYTIGNDVSARDIEGENPLYLPQSKIYANSCSLGPTVWIPAPGTTPDGITVTIRIYDRSGKASYEGKTSTSMMRRSFEELASYLVRYNTIPDGSVLLTGTGIVPPDDFTLSSGDVVEIEVPQIGILRNTVTRLTYNVRSREPVAGRPAPA